MRLARIIKAAVTGAGREIAAFLAGSVLLILVYNLRMDNVFIVYPLLLSMSVLLVYLVIKGIALADFYEKLEGAQTSVEDYIGDDEMQNRVFEAISAIHQKHLGQITRLQAQLNTRNALFSQFIHGMKTSVAVIELACEKSAGTGLIDASFNDITAENERLKKNLEQALNLLRLDAFANDYIPERVDLAALVTHTINDHKRDFIYVGVFPKINGSAVVRTDPKWCGFIISQLISNAIKYSNAGGSILFDIEVLDGRTELRVTDSGIGISNEDLPRVFDMFFTGKNGRGNKSSTGIGLFMAKQTADKLGIAINAESRAGEGTVITLVFRNLTKL